MELTQNQLEHLKDLMTRGKITADEANVQKVRMERVSLIRGSLPSQTRKALNAAVKEGQLVHFKKDVYKPEAYCHPSFDHMAKSERNKHAANTIKALSKCLA